jgi:hypothetical protein
MILEFLSWIKLLNQDLNINMENKEENNKNINKEVKKRSANWALILFYIYIHFFAIIGIYLMLSKAKWMTIFFCTYPISFI